MAKYGEKAQEKIEKALHERKRGTLKSGKSEKKITSREQAIAIGRSEARRAGGKVPGTPDSKSSSAGSRKKSTGKSGMTSTTKGAEEDQAHELNTEGSKRARHPPVPLLHALSTDVHWNGNDMMRPYTLAFEPFRLWSTVAWKAGEMMLASMRVIGYRSDLLRSGRHSADPDNVREYALMGEEKFAAGMESAQAMASDSILLGQKLGLIAFGQAMSNWTNLMSLSASNSVGQSIARQSRIARKTLINSASPAALLSRSTARIAQKGLKPVHSRVTANARLKKRKPA